MKFIRSCRQSRGITRQRYLFRFSASSPYGADCAEAAECSADGGLDANLAPVDLAGGGLLLNVAEAAVHERPADDHTCRAAEDHECAATYHRGASKNVVPVVAGPVPGLGEEALVGLAVGGEVGVGQWAEAEGVELVEGVVVCVVVGIRGGGGASDGG